MTETSSSASTAGGRTRRRFGVFLFANISQRAGQVLLLALLVALARPEDVTWFGLFGSFFLVVVPLTTQNMHLAIGRLWFLEGGPAARKRLASTLLAVGAVLGGFGSLVAAMAVAWFEDSFGFPPEFSYVYPLMIAGSLAYVVATFAHALLRATDRVSAFFWFSVALSLGYPLGLVAAGQVFGYGFVAGAYAFVFAYAVSGLVGIVLLRDLLDVGAVRTDSALLRGALVFGSGTAVYSLTQWVIACAGRWIGSMYLPASGLVGYTLVTQVYAVFASLIVVFFETYRVRILTGYSEGREREALAQLWKPTKQALLVAVVLHVAGVASVPWFPVFLGPAYEIRPSWLVLSMLLTVAGVFSMRAMWIAECLLMTRTFAVLSIGASGIALLLSFVFAGPFGVDGLLAAPIVGVALQAVISTWFLERAHARRIAAHDPGSEPKPHAPSSHPAEAT